MSDAIAALHGMVSTHAQMTLRATPQRTAESRRTLPTPMIAPVMVWVVLTADEEARDRGHVDEDEDPGESRPDEHAGTGLGHAGASEGADQRVRGARREAPAPGDPVPREGGGETGEDQRPVDHLGVHDAL